MRICKVINQLTISFFCYAGSVFNLLWAEEPEDSVQMNLVYFAPSVHIPEKALPCQGVRLVGSRIITSPSCYKRILSLLDQTVILGVSNVEGENIGFIKTANAERVRTGYLLMEPASENIFKSSISFSSANLRGNTELTVHYLDMNNEPPEITGQPLNIEPDSGDSPFIQLPPDAYWPDGAVVEFKDKLLCIVSGGLCLRPKSFIRAYHLDSTFNCKQLAEQAFFNCGERLITTCKESKDDLRVFGNCTNPRSNENCVFVSAYVINNSEDGFGYFDIVNCHSCDASHSDYNWNDNPRNTTNCLPSDCIGGCPGGGKDNSNQGNKLIAPILGSIAGGVIVIGTVTSVAGYLIYRHRRQAGYQKM